MATDMTASGCAEEKLHWAFKMYDKDGSGEQLTSRKKHVTFLMLILKDLFCNTSISETIYVNAGTIELAEMIDIIGTLYEMDGISKVD